MPIATRAERRRRSARSAALHQDAILYNILSFLDEKDDSSVARVCKGYAALRRAFVLPCGAHGVHSQLWNVTYSPDGTMIAADGNCEVKLLDAMTGEQLRLLDFRRLIRTVVFSPQSTTTIAVGGKANVMHTGEGICKIYDVHTGEVLQEYERTGVVWAAAFTADGATLALGGIDCCVATYDVATGEYLSSVYFSNDVNALAFSPTDNRVLASGGDDCVLSVWDAVTGDLMHEHECDRAIYTVNFTPDGSLVAAGSRDRTLSLYNVATGVRDRVLYHRPIEQASRPGTTGASVESSALSADGRWLAVGSYNGTVYLYDIEDNYNLRHEFKRGGPVPTVAFSPNSSRLAIGSWDNSVAVYDVLTGALCRRRESSRPN